MLAFFESEWRLTHFTHPCPEKGVQFRRQMRMHAEGHLQFINRFLRNVGDADLVDAPQRIVKAFDALHARFDGQAGLRRLFKAGDANQRREVLVRLTGRR